MLARGLRAAMLDRALYREGSDDPDTILHATGIVALVGMALGLGLEGAVLATAGTPLSLGGLGERLVALWLSIMTVMVGWILWTVLVYVTGTGLLRGKAGYRQILRALGVSYAPAVLLVLAPVPQLGVLFRVASLLWVLVASVVAIREVQQLDWVGAALSALLGWFLFFFLLLFWVLPGLLLSARAA